MPVHSVNWSKVSCSWSASCSRMELNSVTVSPSNWPYCSKSAQSALTSPFPLRSEEHTSELQSRGHLVCRLLLEKKKQKERRPNQGQKEIGLRGDECARYE